MGEAGGGRELRERDWDRERESHSVVYSPSQLSPIRSEEFDHQQSSITLLKAQLKLVTQERDLLKTDLKRISKERDGAIRHLSLSASPQSSLDTSHHRTNSDTAPSISKAGRCFSLSCKQDLCSVFVSFQWFNIQPVTNTIKVRELSEQSQIVNVETKKEVSIIIERAIELQNCRY